MDVEELIFNMYKDSDIGIKRLRPLIKKQYKLDDIRISDIYSRINNYQISKYGQKLSKGSDVFLMTREECRKRASIIRVTKYQKRKEKGKNYD